MVGNVERLADALKAELGTEKVVVDPRQLARYRGNAWGPPVSKLELRQPLGPPSLAVLPASTDDVVTTVRLATQAGAVIVPHGAGTGVHAGAAPLAGALLLDLGAMREILAVSAEDRTARVQPGVLLGDLDAAAQQIGLMVGHDPWSQPIASVGGAVSTNGVGYLAGKYGSMGEQVLGLEVVLATGEVLRLPAIPKSSTGPVLRYLFIGGEGVFGIITEVAVRLFPRPERRALAGYRFPRFEAGLDAVKDMLAIQLRPSMIDYEEDDPARGPLGVLRDRPSLMYLAFEGFREEVEAQLRRSDAVCGQRAGEPLPDQEIQAFWDERHAPAERYLRERADAPGGFVRSQRRWTSAYLNIGLPVSAIQEFRQRAAAALVPYRLVVKDAGLWGMPELFSVRFEHQAPDDPRAADEVDAGADVGLRLAQELGGSMEYCHGVGLRLAHLMGGELGPGLEVLRRLKRALDPQGLLNPGKLGL